MDPTTRAAFSGALLPVADGLALAGVAPGAVGR